MAINTIIETLSFTNVVETIERMVYLPRNKTLEDFYKVYFLAIHGKEDYYFGILSLNTLKDDIKQLEGRIKQVDETEQEALDNIKCLCYKLEADGIDKICLFSPDKKYDSIEK